MRFVSVKDLRTKGRQVWEDLAKEKELVITSNGKPIALMTGVSEANLEEAIGDLRRARALRAIDEMQRAAVDAGLDKMAGQEIQEKIRDTRKARKRC
ncbi:MAG: type II toxin-antitoxin system Phd/YefM family antitoxin [Acidimicrobiia bacterium]